MAEKTVKSRIQVKRGTSADWALATNFVPKEGEIIFYSDLNKMKIGDGNTLVSSLPFLHVDKSEIDNWSHNHDDKYYTESEIDTKLSSKAASSHSHGNIASGGTLGTASRVVVTDSNKKVTVSSNITTTELDYLDGVTSNIQTQLNGKSDTGHTHTTTIATSSGTNELTLAHGTKYAITAGGDSFVFTMPSDNNTHNSHAIISGTKSDGSTQIKGSASSGDITLGDSGVTAGTYKRVTVNAKGIVTGGDNTDADTNTWRKVQLNGTDKLGTGTSTNPLNIKAGSNMTITESGGTFTFAATDTNTWRPIGTGASDAAAGNHTHDGDELTPSSLHTDNAYIHEELEVADDAYATNITPECIATPSLVVQCLQDSHGLKTSRIFAPTSSGGTDFGAGTSGQVLKSNGSTVYWAADNNTTYTFNGAVSTIKDSNLTASRALVSNSSGKVAVSAVTSTELGYLDGVTSNIQTQLNGKAASSHGTHVTADTVKSALGTGTGTSKYLREDGAWVTPPDTNTTYSAAQTSKLGIVKVFNFYNTVATYAGGTISQSPDSTNTRSINSISSTAGRYYGVEADKDGKLFVNVPWTDTNTDTNTTYSAGTGLQLSGTTFSAKLNSTTSLGTIGTTSKLYAVGVDANGKLCVNVPWTDNNTTYTFNGAVSTIKDSNLTASRALISNSSGKVAVSDVTSTELSYLDGVTSNIQTQLNGKAASSHGTHVTADTVKTALGVGTGTTKYLREDGTWVTPPDTNTTYSLVGANGTTGLIKNGSSVTSTSGLTACPIINGVPYYKDTNTTYSLSSFGITASATELNYVDGVTSNIQTQLDGKAASNHGTHVSYGGNGSATTVSRSDHTHTEYASSSHSHSEYAASGHNHSGTYQPADADLTAIAGLTGTTGLLKKTAANTWSLDTNTYATQSWVTNKGYSTLTIGTTATTAAAGNHTHSGYASSSHSHNEYNTQAEFEDFTSYAESAYATKNQLGDQVTFSYSGGVLTITSK